MLALLDDHCPHAKLKGLLRRLDKIGGAEELPGFSVVADKNRRFLYRLEKLPALLLDPEIHGVEHDAFRPHLLKYGKLDCRVHVGEEEKGSLLEGFRDFWLELRERIQLSLQRLGDVHVIFVLPFPAEILSLRLDSVEQDAPFLQKAKFLVVQILSLDGEHSWSREERGRITGVHRAAAKNILRLAERSAHGVNADRAEDDEIRIHAVALA